MSSTDAGVNTPPAETDAGVNSPPAGTDADDDASLTDDALTETFLANVCPRVRDMPKLLKIMKLKWPNRQWPQKDKSKTNLSYRCIDTLLDILGNVRGNFLAG